MNPVIWIVNGSALVSDQWMRLLGQEGWSVQSMPSSDRFLAAAGSAAVGLALVDESCLKPGGPALLGQMKTKMSGVSFILTAGGRLSDDDVIKLLEAGADDYFPHTMPKQLLLAKLKAHLRRMLPEISRTLDVVKSPEGDLIVDKSKREVSAKSAAKKPQSLGDFTSTEIELLSLFLQRPGEALYRQFIIDTIWQDGGEQIQPGTVDKHVESIRKKLGAIGARIKSVYGVGYAYRPDAKKRRS